MASKKRAFITGITGQDGAYLAHLLVSKGYDVHGLARDISDRRLWRLAHVFRREPARMREVSLHSGDLLETETLSCLLAEIEPDEIYNLASQSHVDVSFDQVEHTAETAAFGARRLFEEARKISARHPVRVYQASTSQLFGQVPGESQNETTPFHPCTPYGIAKLYAHWTAVNYREMYGLFISNGILFSHESPLRASSFVTRKITRAVGRWASGQKTPLALGNLDAERDWGHARDYVDGMWRMLQTETAEDFVLATGQAHSVRRFAELSFAVIGVHLTWTMRDGLEIGCDKTSGDLIVYVDPDLFRPADIRSLTGDYSKARQKLNWRPNIELSDLVAEMVRFDMEQQAELV